MFATESHHPDILTLPLALTCWVSASTVAVGYIRPRADLNFLAGLPAFMQGRPLCAASYSRNRRRLGYHCDVPGLCIHIQPSEADAGSFYTPDRLNMLPTNASSPPVASFIFVGDNVFRLGLLAGAHFQPAATDDNPHDIHMSPDQPYTLGPSTSPATAASMGGAHCRTISAAASAFISPAAPRLLILEPDPPEAHLSRCLWNGVPRSLAIFDRVAHVHLIGLSPDTLRPGGAHAVATRCDLDERPGLPAGVDAAFFNEFLASASPPHADPASRSPLSPVLSPPSHPLDGEQHITLQAAVSTSSATPIRHTPAGGDVGDVSVPAGSAPAVTSRDRRGSDASVLSTDSVGSSQSVESAVSGILAVCPPTEELMRKTARASFAASEVWLVLLLMLMLLAVMLLALRPVMPVIPVMPVMPILNLTNHTFRTAIPVLWRWKISSVASKVFLAQVVGATSP